jgi:hypothetical protein
MGKELCLGAASSVGDTTGLWIYPLDSNEPAKLLTSQVMAASWAPDGTKLIFGLRPPYFELWFARLEPGISTMDALGPVQTLDEHWQNMLRLYTRRIQADPQDAYAYADRARYYDYLRERTKADADMRRWSAAMSGQSLLNSWFSTRGSRRCVIDMPFDCELVFSAERPVNTAAMVSVAFGQKGRCEMKLFEIPMIVMSLMGLCSLFGLDTSPAQANFALGEPVNPGAVVNSPGGEQLPVLSPDGLELYFGSSRSGGYGGLDIWVTKRSNPEDPWGPPANLGPQINASGFDFAGGLSADGLTLYFGQGPWGNCTGCMTTRATKDAPWAPPVRLGPVFTVHECPGPISSDGLELFVSGARPGGFGSVDMWVITRATPSDPWGTPVNLGATINSPSYDLPVWLSPDDLTLIFSSNRPGGFGSWDLWEITRSSKASAWGPPRNLGPLVNTLYSECGATISPDGRWCYFDDYMAPRPGGLGACDIWQAPIIPIADFNADGKVDAKDMALLEINLGKNTTSCDIGPFPWGDGVVDERDLRVLMESLMTPGPNASDVRCDVVLSWISPSFAQACDVYLGASQEAVKAASRTNPQNVLVSQGQTATTYDPPGLLDFSKTYYWRVDFVVPGATPTIYKGPVLEFTTAALTYPIKNITATASSAQAGSGPERTVDGSGLDETDGHSTDQKDMWWSLPTAPHWIQYEFDKVYTLHELWVWNFNSILEPLIGFGAKTVKIEHSPDGTTWTPLANVPEFAKAPGKPGYTANTIVSFAGVPAKFVKLTIEKNWGVAPQTGLSEARFFCIQNAAVPKP